MNTKEGGSQVTGHEENLSRLTCHRNIPSEISQEPNYEELQLTVQPNCDIRQWHVPLCPVSAQYTLPSIQYRSTCPCKLPIVSHPQFPSKKIVSTGSVACRTPNSSSPSRIRAAIQNPVHNNGLQEILLRNLSRLGYFILDTWKMEGETTIRRRKVT